MWKNPFRQNAGGTGKKNGDSELTDKEKKWGMVKFNPVTQCATEQATPWITYKSELMQKKRDEEIASTSVDMNSTNAKNFLKQREQNYRKTQMMQKQKEPTKWEDFNDDAPERKINTSTKRPSKQQYKSSTFSNGNIKKRKVDEKFNRINVNVEKKKPIVNFKDIDVNNFDNRLLNPEQQNLVRKVITSTTSTARGSSLNFIIKDIKRRQKIHSTLSKRNSSK